MCLSPTAPTRPSASAFSGLCRRQAGGGLSRHQLRVFTPCSPACTACQSGRCPCVGLPPGAGGLQSPASNHCARQPPPPPAWPWSGRGRGIVGPARMRWWWWTRPMCGLRRGRARCPSPPAIPTCWWCRPFQVPLHGGSGWATPSGMRPDSGSGGHPLLHQSYNVNRLTLRAGARGPGGAGLLRRQLRGHRGHPRRYQAAAGGA